MPFIAFVVISIVLVFCLVHVSLPILLLIRCPRVQARQRLDERAPGISPAVPPRGGSLSPTVRDPPRGTLAKRKLLAFGGQFDDYSESELSNNSISPESIAFRSGAQIFATEDRISGDFVKS